MDRMIYKAVAHQSQAFESEKRTITIKSSEAKYTANIEEFQ